MTEGLPPLTLYTFGPTTHLWVGKRLEHPDPGRPDLLHRRFSAHPDFRSVYANANPEYQRIWRILPDDPASVRPVSGSDLWSCGPATVVEEISPMKVVPAWEQIVLLCQRTAVLSDGEARQIAKHLATPYPQARPKSTGVIARGLVAAAIWNAAQVADSPQCPIMFRGRAGGGWYEEITDTTWLRVEEALEALAEGMELGTATVELDGAEFGLWAEHDLDKDLIVPTTDV